MIQSVGQRGGGVRSRILSMSEFASFCLFLVSSVLLGDEKKQGKKKTKKGVDDLLPLKCFFFCCLRRTKPQFRGKNPQVVDLRSRLVSLGDRFDRRLTTSRRYKTTTIAAPATTTAITTATKTTTDKVLLCKAARLYLVTSDIKLC